MVKEPESKLRVLKKEIQGLFDHTLDEMDKNPLGTRAAEEQESEGKQKQPYLKNLLIF